LRFSFQERKFSSFPHEILSFLQEGSTEAYHVAHRM
jgi:hypothetical protein